MRKSSLLIAFLFLALPAVSFASDINVFPPADCPVTNPPTAYAITLKNGDTTTRCKNSKEIVALALQNMSCTEGQSLSLDANKKLKCKAATSENTSYGWWTGTFRTAIENNFYCYCEEVGAVPADYNEPRPACGVERGCVQKVVEDKSGFTHSSWTCNVSEKDYKIACNVSTSNQYIGQTPSKKVVRIPYKSQFISDCFISHPDTGKCECPIGRTPALLYEKPHGGQAGGTDKTYVCK